MFDRNEANMLQQIIMRSQTTWEQEAEKNRLVIKRWEKTGLLEGLNGMRKSNMAKLLNNQVTGLRESNLLPRLLTEATAVNATQTATNHEAWTNIAFPLVRRVFANLFAEELVSVQAMSQPTSWIFYLDWKYGTNKPANFNTPNTLYSQSDSFYGTYNEDESTGGPGGRFYGGTDYSYTRNYVSASNVAYTTAAAAWADVEYDDVTSASVAEGSYHKVTISKTVLDAAAATNVYSDPDQVESILLTSGSGIKAQLRRYNKYDSSTGNYTFIISGAISAANSYMTYVEFVKAMDNTTAAEYSRGDFEQGLAGVTTIPQVMIDITRDMVAAGTRKIRTTWTPEIAQDLMAYHGLDFEKEVVDILAKAIGQEIDLHILSELSNQANQTYYWSRLVGEYVNTFTGATIAGTSWYGTQKEWYQTLYDKIVQMSNMIHKRTHLGGATHIVCSIETATILEQAAFLGSSPVTALSATSNPVDYISGVANYIGTAGSQWKVFKSPYIPRNLILVLRKGSEWLDTGYVYAPYVPLTFTDTLVDPTDYNLTKGAMTRYATKMVKKEFFGRIFVKNLNIS